MPNRVSSDTVCRYRIFSEILSTQDFHEYKTYGIQAFFEHCGETVIYETISDISTDENQVKEMVEKFNVYDLELVHMRDVIEDMLL